MVKVLKAKVCGQINQLIIHIIINQGNIKEVKVYNFYLKDLYLIR